MAEFIDNSIEEGLKKRPALATVVTASHREGGPRKVQSEGGSYLRPTIVLCNSFQHPLANREYLCPYASVVTGAAGGDAPAYRVLPSPSPPSPKTRFLSRSFWNRR